MVLRLDPRFPLVWRTPHSLQLGVDRPGVVLEDLSEEQERLLAALLSGISRSGLEMMAGAAGVDGLEEFLDRIRPALASDESVPAGGAVTLVGAGPTAEGIGELLRRSGLALVPDGRKTGLVIIVAHYVIEPELHGRWLRRDLPHLPVVFGDSVVRIGPVVEPGTGPCLYCLDRYRRDADPVWPAIASQLWGRRSAAETAVVAAEVAAVAARIVLARLAAERPGRATSVELDVGSGEAVLRHWQPHPECGCIRISAAPRGTGRASSARRGQMSPVPRTDAAAGERG